VTKAGLAEKVYEKLMIDKKTSFELVEGFIDVLKDALAKGEDVKISGFGSFTVRTKADRRGRNPKTGEDITIFGRKVLTFKPSVVLREYVNS